MNVLKVSNVTKFQDYSKQHSNSNKAPMSNKHDSKYSFEEILNNILEKQGQKKAGDK